MKRLLVILWAFISISKVFGYPITPQTLRKQVENSKYIVIATIVNPRIGEKLKILDKKTGDSVEVRRFSLGGDGTASLKILKVLKGRIDNDSIVVNYPANLSNPRPPRYPHKKKVLAFLNESDTSVNYVTVGLSYGTIVFDLEEPTNVYEKLIKEYLPISKIRNRKKRMTSIASWLVKCCEHRSTRWHGAYELNRSRHWINHYDRSIDNKYANYLTSEGERQLENIVLDSDTISYNELCLSDFVTLENEEKLKEVLIYNLKIFRIFFSRDLMKRYIELEDNSELRLIYEEYKELSLTDKENESKAIELNARFIQIAEKE